MPHWEMKWIKSLSEEKNYRKRCLPIKWKSNKNERLLTGCKKGAKDIWSLVHAKSQIGRTRRKKQTLQNVKTLFLFNFKVRFY